MSILTKEVRCDKFGFSIKFTDDTNDHTVICLMYPYLGLP